MSALSDKFFLGVLTLFIVMALLWGALLPVHEGPDEQNHYRYMIFLKDRGRLPVQLPLPPEVAGEGHQPPLYYWLGAQALKALDPAAAWVELPNNPNFRFNSNPAWFVHFTDEGFLKFGAYARGPHLLRALQLWMPLLTLSALWIMLSALAIGDGARRLAMLVMVFNPGFVFLSGVLNNDHLVLVFFSWAVLVMHDAVSQREWSWGHSLGCGAMLGLGALTKISIFCLMPLALGLALIYGGKLKALALCVVVLLISGWFYARNSVLYGDIFGWTMHTLTCAGTVHVKSWHDLGWAWFWLKRSFESFWIIFGWMSWSAPRWLNAVFIGLSLVAIAGMRRSAYFLLLVFAALSAGVIKFNWNFDPPEGRYFYPALLPIGAFFGLGFDGFRLPPWALFAALFGLNVWLIFYRLIPLYYNVMP